MALEDLSRNELEAEAARRGVADPGSMSRAELLRSLLTKKKSGPLGAARQLFSRVVDRVRDVVPGLPGARTSPPQTLAHRQTERPRLEEPILTRTMAGILAAQGHDDRALAIYDHLTELHPTDPGLLEEAEEVRERLRARGGRPSSDSVVAVRVRPRQILVTWDVAPEALERAARVLGAPGTISARVVMVHPDETKIVDTRTETRRPTEGKGEWLVDVPDEARLTAAVGLSDGDRFVSAAHSRTAV